VHPRSRRPSRSAGRRSIGSWKPVDLRSVLFIILPGPAPQTAGRLKFLIDRAALMNDIAAMMKEYRVLSLAEPARRPLDFAQHALLTERERSEFEGYLAHEAPVWQIDQYLGYFDSFERPWHLTLILTQMAGPGFWQVFLHNWSICDHPWRIKAALLPELRRARAEINPAQYFGIEERVWFDAQHDPIAVHRGSQRGHTRGISWTTDEVTAGEFARGIRCRNSEPVIAHAEVPKDAVFGVIFDRKESEILLDPRRLRKFRIEPFGS
jgi:hypothetical protein